MLTLDLVETFLDLKGLFLSLMLECKAHKVAEVEVVEEYVHMDKDKEEVKVIIIKEDSMQVVDMVKGQEEAEVEEEVVHKAWEEVIDGNVQAVVNGIKTSS